MQNSFLAGRMQKHNELKYYISDHNELLHMKHLLSFVGQTKSRCLVPCCFAGLWIFKNKNFRVVLYSGELGHKIQSIFVELTKYIK